MKSVLALVGAGALLAGCAAGPYYDNGYGYGNGYDAGYGYNGYDYGPGPAYYEPGYVAPSVGFGVGFNSWDGGGHEWHGDHDRGHHDWRGDRGDRDGHGDHGGGDHDRSDDHGEHSGG
ncbi:MAG TPA: hypothetical protein VFE23_03110 [Usitatibacter sp.]|nr:hypothetical protein [Usitatibacter sp.]